jgi:cell division protein FtsQ
MKKMHKIFKIIGIAAGAGAILTLLGFVSSMRSSAPCEAMQINIRAEEPLGMVLESEIRNRIIDENGPVTGDLLGEIDTRSIEKSVLSLHHVRDAAVYKTIDKRIMIDVEERIPIARFIDKKGNHAMVDVEGFLMPLSKNAVPRLPVVSGAFSLDPEKIQACMNVADSLMDKRLASIYSYCMALRNDPFWLAQLQHTEVRTSGEYVVHPQVGSHIIELGQPDDLDQKLEMLRILYAQGLGTSNWNKYSIINLKYKDQIVCTKK